MLKREIAGIRIDVQEEQVRFFREKMEVARKESLRLF